MVLARYYMVQGKVIELHLSFSFWLLVEEETGVNTLAEKRMTFA